jgi:hypothetical protein
VVLLHVLHSHTTTVSGHQVAATPSKGRFTSKHMPAHTQQTCHR